MSVLVSVKVPGDTAVFTDSLKERGDEFREFSMRGRAAGARHHQFAVGDGYVLVVDEWDSADAFNKFFSDPELMDFMGSIGGDTARAPEITIGQAVDSPDKF